MTEGERKCRASKLTPLKLELAGLEFQIAHRQSTVW